MHKTRGARGNIANRFHALHHEAVDDGWWHDGEDPAPLETVVRPVSIREIVSRNDSPDVPFEQSINPYLGCEHGCIYCYARPTHAYWDLSPGLDFESRPFSKPEAPERLRQTLSRRGYRPRVIALGANTDPYQPVEAQLQLTRQLLEVAWDHRHPLMIITKGALILRDLDLLARMAEHDLVGVMVSLTSLDPAIKRTLEPRAAGPQARLRVIRTLADAGIPVGTLIAPVIPAITDAELERLVGAAAEAGARQAGYVLLRLPLEVQPLFEDWLQAHYPQRAAHVMSLMRQNHGGRVYDATPGVRQRGSGAFADLIAQRFAVACRRAGLASARNFELSTADFRRNPQQRELF